MSCKVQQSVCSDCVTYVKSRIKFNTFNTFNNVTNECGTIQPCIIAMQPVVDWFNSKKLWTKLRREQEPYVGVLLNLIALLAANDIAGLTQNCVLSDME